MSAVVFPDYRIFTDAASDLGVSMMEGLPPVTVIPMGVNIGDEVHTFGPNGDLSVSRFYSLQRTGYFASTSQANPESCKAAFEKALSSGYDVLYLGLSTGISGTTNSAKMAAEELREVYPERKIVCIDTLCASVGEGFLVREAARRQAGGMSLDELAAWVEENKLKVCHWFTVDDLMYLKRGGRVSAATAVVGTMLQIKPVLHVDDEGRLINMEKARGRKASIEALVKKLEELGEGYDNSTVFICHGDCREDAEKLKDLVLARTGMKDVFVGNLGAVIGAHAGPGTLALFFMGKHR